jgi:hypothetical protein
MLSWLSAWLGATAGETLGALGSIIGGFIGALGSAAAVFLMLRRQRIDDIERISAAVASEVAELCKSPIGQLGACAQIQRGLIAPPISELKTLFQTPAPVVFPALAAMISRLPFSTLVVTFYAQLQETRGLLAVFEAGFPPDARATGAHIKTLADLVISQCQLALLILRRAQSLSASQDVLAAQQRVQMTKTLEEQLAAAREVFPDAESFQDQHLPTGISRVDG